MNVINDKGKPPGRPQCLNKISKHFIVWWHFSAASYETAVVIILENFKVSNDSKFP